MFRERQNHRNPTWDFETQEQLWKISLLQMYAILWVSFLCEFVLSWCWLPCACFCTSKLNGKFCLLVGGAFLGCNLFNRKDGCKFTANQKSFPGCLRRGFGQDCVSFKGKKPSRFCGTAGSSASITSNPVLSPGTLNIIC